jgi:hypothetical protein
VANTAVHLEIHLRVCVLACLEIVGGGPVGLACGRDLQNQGSCSGVWDSTMRVVARPRVV